MMKRLNVLLLLVLIGCNRPGKRINSYPLKQAKAATHLDSMLARYNFVNGTPDTSLHTDYTLIYSYKPNGWTKIVFEVAVYDSIGRVELSKTLCSDFSNITSPDKSQINLKQIIKYSVCKVYPLNFLEPFQQLVDDNISGKTTELPPRTTELSEVISYQRKGHWDILTADTIHQRNLFAICDSFQKIKIFKQMDSLLNR